MADPHLLNGLHFTADDNVVHHPLGAGSYYYETKDKFFGAILRQTGLIPATNQDKSLTIHIGVQPNNSPHTGTIVTFSVAFFVARGLKTYFRKLNEGRGSLEVIVSLDLVDTAPDDAKTEDINGVRYQRSHRATRAMDTFLPDYDDLMNKLLEYVGGDIRIQKTRQADLLSRPTVPSILKAIIQDRDVLGFKLAPGAGRLGLRAACPKAECGRADKYAVRTTYAPEASFLSRLFHAFFPGNGTSRQNTITFQCHEHGPYNVSLDSPKDVARLELNTPLRNLVRTYADGLDTLHSKGKETHLRVTGADYSGMYQEQTLFASIMRLASLASETRLPAIAAPTFVYSPLILDWAGSKLSKSLYVKKDAYSYLGSDGLDMEYLLAYSRMKESGKDVMCIIRDVERWVDEPKKLFRPYTIEYIHRLFTGQQPAHQEAMMPLNAELVTAINSAKLAVQDGVSGAGAER
ncbi:hypothetical protein FISHEDRAFT_45225 [Fistulina hepatica ATCC 64428]|uniref:Uncharacterized protein n=1 Tax=Fistulina hepatica ATCC 64428 TaxID=1128425 RepID=A0A0D7A916_9AGAR|nr:hypothetical protein FISHEDRAFT_45225 [Fistulina hepatica ATCC 64428]